MTMTSINPNPTLIREYDDLARRFDHIADDLDKLADDVFAWGKVEADPNIALGLISRSDELANRGQALLNHHLVGDSTKSSHGNEASIALGVNRMARSSKLAYALMYRMTQDAKYPGRTHNEMAVKAASIRVYASSARVVASLARSVAMGKYRAIG